MDNPEIPATLSTHDTGRRRTNKKWRHNTTQKTTTMSNTDTTKHRGWIQEQYGHCQTPGVNTGAWKG